MAKKDYFKGRDSGASSGRGRRTSSNYKKRAESKSSDRKSEFGSASTQSNEMVSHMSSDTLRGGTSEVFPHDAASMRAFGNFVTSAGQENFIADFNAVKRTNDVEQAPNYLFSSAAMAGRTSAVMTIGVTHYFGSVTRDQNVTANPITMAALNLKQFIDTSFGTRTDYDPQDLMLYLMAVSAVFPYIAEIKRDIKLTLSVIPGQYPQLVPRALFASLAIPDEAQRYSKGEGAMYAAKNLRNYVDRLNQLIMAFNALPMPPELPIFGTNDFMFEKFYLDSPDTTTAQIYAFFNSQVWFYEEMENPYLSAVTMKVPMTIGEKLDTLESVIMRLSALRTSSTAMLQNLFNAYGSKDTVRVPTLDFASLEQVEFVYDPNVLTMIENMVIANPQDVTISDIVPNHELSMLTGYVYLKDSKHDTNVAVNLPLQFHKPWEEIMPDDIGWALRLHPIFHTLDRFAPKDEDHTGEDYIEELSSAGLTGFAIATSCTIHQYGKYNEVGYIWGLYRRNPSTLQDYQAMMQSSWAARDFSAAPMLVDASITGTDTDTVKTQIQFYSGHRDVEVTYRLEDVYMHWTYLTLNMWAANVNRNVLGTRNKY